MSQVAIIMRSCNDKGVIERTLEALQQQTFTDWELFNIDSSSQDGTAELIAPVASIQTIIPGSSYVPGKVLNMGATQAASPYLIFLNSDCVPVNRDWLTNMVKGLRQSPVVYGRQVARSDAWMLYKRDYEYSFPDTEKEPGRSWWHNSSFQNFFSMANCGMHRNVWEQIPFDNSLQYSEDIEWSTRVREANIPICYLPNAVVEHSHNYTSSQCYRRFFGEGFADGQVFQKRRFLDSFVMRVVLPYLNAIRKDLVYAMQHQRGDWFRSIPLRWSMHWGRYQGLQEAYASNGQLPSLLKPTEATPTTQAYGQE